MIDEPTRARAIRAASRGMSMEGIAHLCGVSRSTLTRYRTQLPEFNAALLAALAQYEETLLDRYFIASDVTVDDEGSPVANPAMAAQLKGMLAQRFPQRHGVDPRLRLDARQAQEGYQEDLADPTLNPSTQTPATVIAALVDRMLKEDEGATTNADDHRD